MVVQVKIFQAGPSQKSLKSIAKSGIRLQFCPMAQTIQFGDPGELATRELARRFSQSRPELARILATLEGLDRQYGGHGALPAEDAEELVSAALAEMARLEAAPEFADLTLGIALWAMRHGVAIRVVEPIANALALRSNAARTREELAAAFGLMQGVIAHVSPQLSADLERSNPERAWRVLHANFAITAIRTEDAQMMAYAFDALDGALPDERAGFYAEALALAMNPRIPEEVRGAIAGRHRRWLRDS